MSLATSMKCNFCKKPSHFEKDCYTKKRISANFVQEVGKEEDKSSFDEAYFVVDDKDHMF